ncbi:DUF2783 domain-containing protein [Ramlibacter sp.]|uniref:DUF2783 domain-containing protein n=1 Tax=Ramlibacter sp. TaxID=1917967 RepID=UPI002602F013|nr:DUF2783 domain-containing protein [Ramlibacter sp.]
MSTLTFEQLETLYDELAAAIDQAGPAQESVFLAKLVLAMAHEFGHADRISALLRECLAPPAPPAEPQRLI